MFRLSGYRDATEAAMKSVGGQRAIDVVFRTVHNSHTLWWILRIFMQNFETLVPVFKRLCLKIWKSFVWLWFVGPTQLLVDSFVLLFRLSLELFIICIIIKWQRISCFSFTISAKKKKLNIHLTSSDLWHIRFWHFWVGWPMSVRLFAAHDNYRRGWPVVSCCSISCNHCWSLKMGM